MKKKLTLLFTLLALCVSGAWAAVTDLPEITTDANNPKLYVVKNTRSGQYMAYRGDSETIRQTGDISAASLWYFTAGNGESTANEICVRFRNYFADGKAINLSVSSFSTDGGNVYIKKTAYTDNGLAIQHDSRYYNHATYPDYGFLNDNQSNALTIYYYDDPGSIFVITSIDDILEDLKTQYS